MDYRTIFITGAASGIGRALALALSAPGRVLCLLDRNAVGLEETRTLCLPQQAQVHTVCADVTDREAMTRWCATHPERPVDLMLICAGVTGGMDTPLPDGSAFETATQIRHMLAVNLDGALNALLPMMDRMKTQPRGTRGQRGQICAIASVAGLVSYPGTASYCASKAALDRFIVASGAYSQRAGIYLSSVCCSFVDTPMVAQNRFPMPGLMAVDKAVTHILRGLERRKRRIVFPAWLILGSRFMDILPIRLAELYYLNQKAGQPGQMPQITDASL